MGRSATFSTVHRLTHHHDRDGRDPTGLIMCTCLVFHYFHHNQVISLTVDKHFNKIHANVLYILYIKR